MGRWSPRRRQLTSQPGAAVDQPDTSGRGEVVTSRGTLHVNGSDSAHLYSYWLTEERLVWHRERDEYAGGFALDEVDAFGCWEDLQGFVVFGVDVHQQLLDLVLLPSPDLGRQDVITRQRLVVDFLVGALRARGARELAEPRDIGG